MGNSNLLTQSMIIRPIIIAASLLILVACQTTGGDVKPVNLRSGMPVSELINGYGQPSSVEALADGASYTWNLSSGRLINTENRRSGVYSTMSGNYNPQVVRIFCQLSVTTDNNGMVTTWQAEGEGCRQILLNQL